MAGWPGRALLSCLGSTVQASTCLPAERASLMSFAEIRLKQSSAPAYAGRTCSASTVTRTYAIRDADLASPRWKMVISAP